jgi:hypothetical protein
MLMHCCTVSDRLHHYAGVCVKQALQKPKSATVAGTAVSTNNKKKKKGKK